MTLPGSPVGSLSDRWIRWMAAFEESVPSMVEGITLGGGTTDTTGNPVVLAGGKLIRNWVALVSVTGTILAGSVKMEGLVAGTWCPLQTQRVDTGALAALLSLIGLSGNLLVGPAVRVPLQGVRGSVSGLTLGATASVTVLASSGT